MPFARTWSEELVAEWLQLEGYLVEIGVPVHAIRAGGRFTADIVGAKLQDNSLKIIHIEVGTLSSGKASHITNQRILSYEQPLKKFVPER